MFCEEDLRSIVDQYRDYGDFESERNRLAKICSDRAKTQWGNGWTKLINHDNEKHLDLLQTMDAIVSRASFELSREEFLGAFVEFSEEHSITAKNLCSVASECEDTSRFLDWVRQNNEESVDDQGGIRDSANMVGLCLGYMEEEQLTIGDVLYHGSDKSLRFYYWLQYDLTPSYEQLLNAQDKLEQDFELA